MRALCLLLLVVWPLAPEAQDALTPAAAEALRKQAIVLSAMGDSTGAVASFEASLDGGWTSAQAQLDLGLLHIARGEAGRAVLAVERASRLDPISPGIATARREAFALAGQVAPRVPAPLIASRTVAARLGAGALVALALVLYLGAASLGVVWFRRRDRRVGWAAIAVAPFALAALVVAGIALWDAGRPTAVALTDVALQTRPSPEAAASGAVRAGEIVRIGDASGLWRQVEVGEETGWVPEQAVAGL